MVLSPLRLIPAMRSKASKRPLSTVPANAGEPDEDARSKKRVRWDPKSDGGDTGTVTASDDFEGTGEEHSTASDNENVRLTLHFSTASCISRSRYSFIDLSCD